MRRFGFRTAAVIIVSVALLASACSKKKETATPSGGSTGAAAIQAPADIAAAGQIVWCSDITYPPEEYYDENNNPIGSDIDIGKKIGELMGVGGQFDNTGFDGIIPALQGKKCDAIISGMNDTPERQKQVDFVDYLSVGQSLMVPSGNPDNISDLTSLSGKTVSVEVGTTNADFLNQESDTLKGQGKPGIDVITFPKDTDAANALKTGKVDAYFGDSPVVAYYIAQDPASFGFGGSPINPLAVGIAIRKDSTDLRDAIQKAIDTMYADGSMCTILGTWQMKDFALEGNTC